MRILVVIGDCLSINSSANLCHLAYLRALAARGYEIDLLCADGKNAKTDGSLTIPEKIHVHLYPQSLYEQLAGLKRRETASVQAPPGGSSSSAGVGARIKKLIRSCYGVYGPYRAWHEHAVRFRSERVYDIVLSISCPFVSHLTALSLIRKKRIRCGRWIQIWEDPWYADIASASSGTKSVRRAERFLCEQAQDIVYVSPLTLDAQKKLYPSCRDKMRCVPPIAYYQTDGGTPPFTSLSFGYFGDYEPEVRDLSPFYEAAVRGGWRATICGRSAAAFASTDTVTVKPRVPLKELRRYEEQVNVLVFLCNRHGGQIPGKIYQYSATDKLILFILDGEDDERKALRRWFEPLGRYVFCENTAEDIARAVREMAAGNYRDSAKICAAFDAERILGQLLGDAT